MHFAINRTQQAPISDINEFEDQQIEYAKQLQDGGKYYTYDIFQHELMKRAHIDPELFRLRDKEKRDIYRRIISHLKTELEFKRAEFDTIRHKDKIASYEQTKAQEQKLFSHLESVNGFVHKRKEQMLTLLTGSTAELKKFTVENAVKVAEDFEKSKHYIITGFSSKNKAIHDYAKALIIAFNDAIDSFLAVVDKKIDLDHIKDNSANAKKLYSLLQGINTSKLSHDMPITPQKVQGSTLASQAITHAAEADQDDADDAAERQQHERLKQQKKAIDDAKNQVNLEGFLK